MYDSQKNEAGFANVADVVVGTKLKTDAGFTCMKDGEIKEVFKREDGALCIHCADGTHDLEGQIDDERGVLVGLTLASCPTESI